VFEEDAYIVRSFVAFSFHLLLLGCF